MVSPINYKFLKNKEVKNIDEFIFIVHPDDLIIYEVVRIIDGKILFLKDHIDRFFSSFRHAGLIPAIGSEELANRLDLLIKSNNNIEVGNIKFQLVFSNTAKTSEFLAYFIPHSYPSEEQYNNGVSVAISEALRTQPNAKIQHTALLETLNRIMEEEKVYEVILVHPEGYITEGSRSNLFMIKNNEVYTPKVTDILPGITRKYILQVCKDLNLILNERRIFRDELFAMDALFITGTSPKVLPIRNIYYANFDVKHPVLRLIMKKFDELIENYLKNSPNFF